MNDETRRGPDAPPRPPLVRPGTETPDHEPGSLRPLWQRQIPLLFIVAASLLVALAASELLREILFPVFWDPPFYVNPFITLTVLIYVGLGLVMLSGPGDQGWPFYLVLIGAWIFVVVFEFSIVQWFLIQQGVLTSASRVSPIIFTASAAAVGAAILLHMNQLSRRLYQDLKQRGLDPDELLMLEHQAGQEGRTFVAQLVGLAFAASLVLWIADLIVGTTPLGLDVLGILAGLLIMSVLLVYSYSVLKKGPALEDATRAASPETSSPYRSPGHPEAPLRGTARPAASLRPETNGGDRHPGNPKPQKGPTGPQRKDPSG